jgi:hypothetical protein
VALGVRIPLPVGTEMCECVSRRIFSSYYCIGRFLCNGVCIVWNGIPVLWELVCSAVFPYSP